LKIEINRSFSSFFFQIGQLVSDGDGILE